MRWTEGNSQFLFSGASPAGQLEGEALLTEQGLGKHSLVHIVDFLIVSIFLPVEWYRENFHNWKDAEKALEPFPVQPPFM